MRIKQSASGPTLVFLIVSTSVSPTERPADERKAPLLEYEERGVAYQGRISATANELHLLNHGQRDVEARMEWIHQDILVVYVVNVTIIRESPLGRPRIHKNECVS